MPTPVDMHFNFASPCGYIAAAQIEDPVERRGRTAVFRTHFVDDRSMATLDVLLEAGTALGVDADGFGAAIHDGASRQRLKTEIDMAGARGVFALPFFIVEGERFWDVTRLPQLERRLASGPHRCVALRLAAADGAGSQVARPAHRPQGPTCRAPSRR